jgi:acetyl esterase/lipase
MMNRLLGWRRHAATRVWLVMVSVAVVVTPPVARGDGGNVSADANGAAEDLARAAADRFAWAVNKADVAAATAECSLPWLNAFGQTAPDAAALKQGLEWYTDFPRRNPNSGIYYRGLTACLPYDQYRKGLDDTGKEPDAERRKVLANLDGLKLAAPDRVLLPRWTMAYSILVRVRDGTATVAGLGPALPDALLKKAVTEGLPYTARRNVVYGRKYGTALTLDVLTPRRHANGAAVIHVLSGDFVSEPLAESDEWVVEPLLSRGYTVVTVTHGGVPRYTIAEIVRDLYRAARFTRYHAADYGIDPDRIGVEGESSGGYLALMLATARAKEPPLADGIDPVGAEDAIDKVSCRVQAAACFFPPSDWLDYGEPNLSVMDVPWGGQRLRSVLEFREFDLARFTFVPVTDKAKVQGFLSRLSPARRVTRDAAPTLIIHGEKDPTVPLQQSRLMTERLNAADVPAELVVKQGAGHGWENMTSDKERIVAWFDRYLARRP